MNKFINKKQKNQNLLDKKEEVLKMKIFRIGN